MIVKVPIVSVQLWARREIKNRSKSEPVDLFVFESGPQALLARRQSGEQRNHVPVVSTMLFFLSASI